MMWPSDDCQHVFLCTQRWSTSRCHVNSRNALDRLTTPHGRRTGLTTSAACSSMNTLLLFRKLPRHGWRLRAPRMCTRSPCMNSAHCRSLGDTVHVKADLSQSYPYVLLRLLRVTRPPNSQPQQPPHTQFQSGRPCSLSPGGAHCRCAPSVIT